MPAGQAHTTWFPGLKDILKDQWDSALTIPQQLKLMTKLNIKLQQIRTELKIQPPMMWCPKCQKRHRSRFVGVSITAMYYALMRFELCSEDDFKKLKKNWNKYSKTENIDIYGNAINEKNKEEHG